MTCVTVKTQTELDAALSGDADCVHIESDAGVWLRVSASGKTLRLYGSASAELYDSASARLYGSASARLSGSASAELYDSASARLYGSASAELYDSASARLYGSASAELYDSASAEAAGASSVHADDRSRVTAYPVGETVRCTDWRDDNGCGGGLHASPRPWQAKQYARPGGVRYLLVTAPVESIRPIEGDKCKAPAWTVLAEVDASGRELAPTVAETPKEPS